MAHHPSVVVASRFCRSERMRRALIYAWCELRNAAVDAHRIYDNPYTARRAAAQARGLIGVFGKNLARRPFGRAVRGGE